MTERSLELFKSFCSIPHPSGHEEALARFIIRLAEEKGLQSRRDAAGNLRIDRPASPGKEGAPQLILQGHLDMVPQCDHAGFDFRRDPISTEVRGEYLYSSGGTTLGADDGVGVAAALALLLDEELHAGALAGLFTVSEEIGLIGAERLNREMLNGDILLNLDSEEEGEFCIGGAGGARMTLEYPIIWSEVKAGSTGVAIELAGLKGGHSGMDINLNRGNAIIELVRFLGQCDLQIGELAGGDLDNAIPRSCRAVAATTDFGSVVAKAAAYLDDLKIRLDVSGDCRLTVTPERPPRCIWCDGRQKLRKLGSIPDGVLEFDDQLNMVITSSNLASVRGAGDNLVICTSQRSLNNGARELATIEVRNHFPTAKARVDSEYGAWAPRPDSPLLEHAMEVYRALFDAQPAVKTVHAGLECGLFAAKRPDLEMLSFGPTVEHPHSPEERLHLPSVGRFVKFLRALIESY